MSYWLISTALALASLSVIGLTTLGLARSRAYLRLLKYDPAQDCFAGFTSRTVEIVPLQCDASGFELPNLKPDVTGALLELDVRASGGGSWFEPGIDIRSDAFTDRQKLERGVSGVRFLDISRLLATGAAPGKRVNLRGRHLRWRTNAARLHLSREKLSAHERILIVAPHPDDAEIAAYGLYTDRGATIVTITAGDESDRYSRGPGIILPRPLMTRLRVWDSLTVPQLGGVSPDRVVNLCYSDGKLSNLRAEPGRDFCGDFDLKFGELRKLNRSPLAREGAVCSWVSLVRDLEHILSGTQPTVIVAPHPGLDPHADHLFTTVALCEAIRNVGQTKGRFFFYVNHNRHSEMWPYGPAGSGTALLPILFDDVTGGGGFYSHPLSPRRQLEKFLALEAMHDLREVSTLEQGTVRSHLRALRSALSAFLQGLDNPPTSYFRRSVRPDEFFFTNSLDEGAACCARMTRHG